MAVLGLGLGATMQNLVLAVQNNIAAVRHGRGQLGGRVLPHPRRLDRRLGARRGAGSHVGDRSRQGLAAIPGAAAAAPAPATRTWHLKPAPPAIRTLIRVSYGDATGQIFLISAVVAVVALVAIVFIQEVALKHAERRPAARDERRVGPPSSRETDDEAAGPPAPGGRAVGSAHGQRGVQGDVDAGQRLAHRAAGLGLLGGLLEAGGVEALDLAADGQLDAGDLEAAAPCPGRG